MVDIALDGLLIVIFHIEISDALFQVIKLGIFRMVYPSLFHLVRIDCFGIVGRRRTLGGRSCWGGTQGP